MKDEFTNVDDLVDGEYTPNTIDSGKDLAPIPWVVLHKGLVIAIGVFILCVALFISGLLIGKAYLTQPTNVTAVESNATVKLVNYLGYVSNNCSIVPLTYFDGVNISTRGLIDSNCFGSKYMPMVIDSIVNITNDCNPLNLLTPDGLPRVLIDQSCVKV